MDPLQRALRRVQRRRLRSMQTLECAATVARATHTTGRVLLVCGKGRQVMERNTATAWKVFPNARAAIAASRQSNLRARSVKPRLMAHIKIRGAHGSASTSGNLPRLRLSPVRIGDGEDRTGLTLWREAGYAPGRTNRPRRHCEHGWGDRGRTLTRQKTARNHNHKTKGE